MLKMLQSKTTIVENTNWAILLNWTPLFEPIKADCIEGSESVLCCIYRR